MTDTATITEELSSIVQQVARSGALTPDAISQFEKLRLRCDELERINKRLQAENINYSQKIRQLEHTIETRDKELAEANKRAAQTDQERFDNKWNRAVAIYEQDRRQELRSILHDLCRNTTYRETLMKSRGTEQPAQWQGGQPIYGTAPAGTDEKTTTEE